MFKRISFFILLAIVFSIGCKKYPDGPLISFQSKLKRVQGTWNVVYFSVNGYDSTSYLQAQPYYGSYNLTSKEGDMNNIDFYFQSKDPTWMPTPNYNWVGKCKFVNNKKSLYFDLRDYTVQGSCGPFRAQQATWDIMRLTKDDL